MVIDFILETLLTLAGLFIFSKVTGLNASNKFIFIAAVLANMATYLTLLLFGYWGFLYPIALIAVLYKEEGADFYAVLYTSLLTGGALSIYIISS